ncbi:hypothetical protein ALP43_200013 [Pseudomonas azotoformans]|nr:hypothetical protein ALP43_200013 [Pseudomonas azotoformans]
MRFGTGLVVEQIQGFALLGELFNGGAGALFELPQLGLALVEAIADQHQLLQAVTVGVPGIAQRREGGAVLKLSGQALQALGALGLRVLQTVEQGLAFGAGAFVLVFFLVALGQFAAHVGEGVLLFDGLAQQGRGVGLVFQGRGQCCLGDHLLVLRLLLAGVQGGLLLEVLGNLRRQGRQQGGEFCLAQEVMALRCQLLQKAQVLALLTLVGPGLLVALQLLHSMLMALLPFTQLLEPGVLQLQLLELGLLALELLLGLGQLLIQLGAGFGGQGHHAGGLVL